MKVKAFGYMDDGINATGRVTNNYVVQPAGKLGSSILAKIKGKYQGIKDFKNAMGDAYGMAKTEIELKKSFVK